MSSERARLILLAALVLGIAGDQLLRTWPWGLGFVAFVGLAVVALGATAGERPFGRDGTPAARERWLLAGVMLLAAVGLLFRDAETLVFYNAVTLLAAAALVVWRARGASLTGFRLRDALGAGWATGTSALVGAPVLVFGDIEWGGGSGLFGPRGRKLLFGTLLATPPILLVAGLLGSADPVFGEFLDSWRRLGLEKIVEHCIVAGVIAWPLAGWLRGAVKPVLEPFESGISFESKLDFFGVAPALYGVAGLLAAFLGLQARALFGGPAYVQATTGLTYAEYARGGFFQLVAVTAVVLAILLVGDWIMHEEETDHTSRFRATGWVILGLLGVLMVSALQRMWVYVSYYGLSDTRLYATAGMVWVGAALALFGATILRGRRGRFGVGLLVASAVWILTLNVIDPETIVVRVNLARAEAGNEFDVLYHTWLSADAVPALMEAAPRLPIATCLDIVDHLGQRDLYLPDDTRDWRGWTLPLARARRYFPVIGLAQAEQTYCGRERRPEDPPMSVRRDSHD